MYPVVESQALSDWTIQVIQSTTIAKENSNELFATTHDVDSYPSEIMQHK
jgi:hypothetical protein